MIGPQVAPPPAKRVFGIDERFKRER